MCTVTKCPECNVMCSWHPLIIIHVKYATYSDLAVLAYILMCVPGPSSLSHAVSSFPLFPATKTAQNCSPPFSGSNFLLVLARVLCLVSVSCHYLWSKHGLRGQPQGRNTGLTLWYPVQLCHPRATLEVMTQRDAWEMFIVSEVLLDCFGKSFSLLCGH